MIEAPYTLIRFHWNKNGAVLLRFQKHLRPHLLFSYRFRPSTLQRRIHFENSTHAHFNISAREIGAKLKLHGSVSPPFWILTVEWSSARSVYFDDVTVSPSILENSVFKKHRFQIALLWRAFSNGFVFGDRFRCCSVDDSRTRSKTAPFSFENRLVWTGP